jgi:hypothetical protein
MLFTKQDFIAQQGVSNPHPASSQAIYTALQFQPRLIGALVLVGAATGRPEFFVALGLIQWWSVAAPRWNPFDLLYNRFLAARGGVSLMPAAPPRLFAQAIAGSLSLSIAMMLALGNDQAALLLECVFMLAVAAVVFGRYCPGASLFHALNRRGLLRGRAAPGMSRTT